MILKGKNLGLELETCCLRPETLVHDVKHDPHRLSGQLLSPARRNRMTETFDTLTDLVDISRVLINRIIERNRLGHTLVSDGLDFRVLRWHHGSIKFIDDSDGFAHPLKVSKYARIEIGTHGAEE